MLIACDAVLIALSRNNNSIFIAPTESKVLPLEIPCPEGGEAFWLDSRTIAHVVENEEYKSLDIYGFSVKLDASNLTASSVLPIFIGSLPTTSATNFRYVSEARQLIFSDYVYADGNLNTVAKQDEKWANRGTSALVYDSMYIRCVQAINNQSDVSS